MLIYLVSHLFISILVFILFWEFQSSIHQRVIPLKKTLITFWKNISYINLCWSDSTKEIPHSAITHRWAHGQSCTSPSITHLERVPSTLLLQHLRLKDLPDEPLGIVDSVLGVAVGQVHSFVSGQHRCGGERDGAGDALPPLFIRYHLHLSAPREEDADRAERGAQVQAYHFGFGGR